MTWTLVVAPRVCFVRKYKAINDVFIQWLIQLTFLVFFLNDYNDCVQREEIK